MTSAPHTIAGSDGDSHKHIGSWTYTRNPASQIASQTRTNDAYAWGGHYGVNRAYTTDGLNRYTTAGAAGFTYDGNGNLITTPGRARARC